MQNAARHNNHVANEITIVEQDVDCIIFLNQGYRSGTKLFLGKAIYSSGIKFFGGKAIVQAQNFSEARL
jgi:hypothetical protein